MAPPASELEEAEQLAEALRRSLVLESEPEPTLVPAALPAPEQPTAEPAPTGVLVDIRHYAVWVLPGNPQGRGIWSGPHPDCWDSILVLCPGGRYGGAARLRRFATLEAARAGYEAEASRHRSPLPSPEHSP